ncbi:MAG: GNAT family N-acetyltransferase [Planctomycetota bacterium]
MSDGRVLVRPFCVEDRPDAEAMWQELHGERLSGDTLRWLSLNPAELQKLLQRPFGDRALILRETGQLIGSVGLVPQPAPYWLLDEEPVRDGVVRCSASATTPWTVEIGLYWALRPGFRGRGYATDGAALMRDLAFRSMRVGRVVAYTEKSNRASRRVMDRLGMRPIEVEAADAPWFQVVGVSERHGSSL